MFSVISPAGGIRPADRRRAPMVLSLGEREEISRGLSTQCSLRSIAHRLGRSPSTISREVRRNGGPERYRAARSDQAAWDRARRPKLCKLACCPSLARTVSAKLQLNWSPEQIAGWLKRTYPGRGAQSGVARDDLPQPVHPGPRRAEEGTARAPPGQTNDPPLSTRQHEAEWARPDQGCDLHPRAASLRRRSSCSRPLGRRSHRRVQEQLCRDPGRAPLALRHADQGRQQRHRRRRHRPDQALAEVARRALSIIDLGPRQGTRRPPAAEAGHRHRGLLLRSAITLAAGLEREHQPIAAPISAARHRPRPTQPGQTQRHRQAAQRASQKDLALSRRQRRSSPSVLRRSVEPTANSGLQARSLSVPAMP